MSNPGIVFCAMSHRRRGIGAVNPWKTNRGCANEVWGEQGDAGTAFNPAKGRKPSGREISLDRIPRAPALQFECPCGQQ